MSGLLDIWEQWRNSSGYGETTGSSTDFSKRKTFKRGETERSNLSTAGGVEPSGNTIPRVHVGRQNIGQVSQKSNTAITPESSNFQTRFKSKVTLPDGKTQWMGPGEQVQKGLTQSTEASKNTTNMRSDGMDLKFHAGNVQDQQKWCQTLADKIGFDYDKAATTWKDKGGFEGLMANPAFTIGLAFLSAGAEGKNIGQGALDNVMKAAGISSHYKKIIEDRKMEPIQATASDIGEVKDMLKSINIEEGNWFENILSGPGAGARYEAAVEEIALEFQKEIREKQAALKREGKSQVIKRTDQLKILERLVKSGKIQKKESLLSKLGITSSTLQMPVPMAEGGPVQAGKPYVVGEKGPEVIIPKSDGNVLANDDSQIFAMLLASNPQLQNVSRQRAEKILRSRFPEYFEV